MTTKYYLKEKCGCDGDCQELDLLTGYLATCTDCEGKLWIRGADVTELIVWFNLEIGDEGYFPKDLIEVVEE